MRYWDTTDRVTNSNLAGLESIERSLRGSDTRQFTELLISLIRIEQMLPRAVRAHFDLPYLFIGNAAESWSARRVAEKAEELAKSLGQGLERVEADASLKHGGSSNLSDRPRSRGEAILAAIAEFEKVPSDSSLAKLEAAVSPTRLQSEVQAIGKALRKRHSRGAFSPEYEVAGIVSKLKFYADHYHYLKAE